MLIIFTVSMLFTQIISVYNSVHAESTPVTIEFFPTSVELPIQGDTTSTSTGGTTSTKNTSQALMIVRNSSTDTVRGIQIKCFSNINNVELEATRTNSNNPRPETKIICKNNAELNTNKNLQNINIPGDLKPGIEYFWNLKISQTDNNESVNGKFYFYMTYQILDKRTRRNISKMITTSLDINSKAIKKPEDVVNVEVKSKLETLNENRSGIAYLSITNKANFPITIKQVEPSGSDFISFKDKNSKDSKEIKNQPIIINKYLKSNMTYSMPIEVKADRRVKPGKYILLFDVQLEWQQDGKKQITNIIKEKEVEIGVFGESGILQILQVPSILLLPGFLVLMTIRQLWTWDWLNVKDRNAQFLPQGIADPYFWFYAVLISLAIAILYLRFFGQNFLEIYGLEDVFWIWIWSIFGGAVLYFIWGIQKREITPNPNDDPIKILIKIDRLNLIPWLNLSPWLDAVSIEGQNTRALLLAPRGSQLQGACWVVPHIVVTFISPLPPAPNDYAQLRTQIEEEERKHEKASAAKLAQLLKKGEDQRFLTVNWETVPWVTRPTLEDRPLRRANQPESIFQF